MVHMKKFLRFLLFFVPLALLVWWLFVPHQREEKDAAATNNLAQMMYRDVFAGVDYNPDVPPFAEQLVDESQYLQLRGEAIARMRGVPYDLPYDARSLALTQMMQQEAVSPFASQAWQFVGPAPLPNGQTTGTATPVSGRTIAITIHPTNPNIVYVGTAQGGLYRTLDGGTTWTQLMDNAMSLAIGAITIDPANTTRLFVGTGENGNSADSYFGVGLYIITNAETTPTLSGPYGLDGGGNNVMNKRSISKIIVDPTDSNIIYVAMARGIGGIGASTPTGLPIMGIYRSTNALSASPTFTLINVAPSGDKRIMDILLDANDATRNTMIATVMETATVGPTGEGGIYRTTNLQSGSPTFTRVMTPTANARIELAQVGTTYVAAVGELVSGSSYGRVYVSSDGISWSSVAGGAGFCGGQCWYDIALAVDHVDPQIIHLGGAANSGAARVMIRSANGGATFSNVDTGMHADTHAAAVAPSNPNIVYVGSDGGIWKSTDRGLTYTSMNNSGFSATQFMGLELHPLDPYFMIGGTQDNGTPCYGTCYTNPAQTWTRADWGDGGYAVIDQNAVDTYDVTMYHTYYNQSGSLIGYGRVTNTAQAHDGSWSFRGCGGSPNGINCADAVRFYAPMERGPGNPSTLYFGSDKLYRSSDEGLTMVAVSQDFNIAASAIAIGPNNDNVRIIGLTNGQVYATSTGSTTLVEVTPPTTPFPTTFDVGAAAIHPTNPDIAFVAYSGFFGSAGSSLWKTSNLSAGAGAIWTASASGIPDVPINAIAIHPYQPNLVYVGTDIGVYASTDGGATWAPYGTALPRVAVFGLEIHPLTLVLRAATHGRGIWETTTDTGTANLAMDLTVDNATPDQGTHITYTVTITNSGNGPAAYGVMTDTLPAGLTFMGSVTVTPVNNGVPGTAPVVATNVFVLPGQTVQVAIPVMVNNNAPLGLLTNTVSFLPDGASSPLTASVDIDIQQGIQYLFLPIVVNP
jgi:uncharacterized repeat protein (TIGR01451 family)